MERVINFLNELQQNNHKEWFDSHKNEYKEAQIVFNTFTEKLIEGIASFDPSVKNLTVKDCTYRIYRDVRFSKDKTPYKTHMGAYISPKGKNGGYSGYYFHIEAANANYIGGNILSTGIYMPQPRVLKSIREEIMLNGENFLNTIKLANGFSIQMSDSLKRVPSGFPADSKYADFFKLKNYFLAQFLTNDFILKDNLLESVINEYKKTLAFNNLINKAVEYGYENM
ncbi:MAG: DUF2461 domain-containing protein [Thiovulaceae bacterium]|nr:DUF2461 domain-containing protein [Sulfurimonadaceae bacterium]